MVKVTFEQWWQEFVRKNDRDVYIAIERLQVYVDRLSVDLRSEFIGELAQVVTARHVGRGVAAAVLRSVADAPACDILFRQLRHLARADLSQQEQEATIVGILALAGGDSYDAVVTTYLFKKPVVQYYTGVVWTQWPRRKEVFGRAHVRYFEAVSPESVKGTAVIQALLSKPDALVSVHSACGGSQYLQLWARIVDAVRGTTLPGMTDAQRLAVSRILAKEAG